MSDSYAELGIGCTLVLTEHRAFHGTPWQLSLSTSKGSVVSHLSGYTTEDW